MIQWGILGVTIIGAGYLIKYFQEPQKIELTPPGAVIFNPAPSTGSATFLGDITGNPTQKYWNITAQIGDIPGGYVQAASSYIQQGTTILYSPVMSSK